MKVKLTATEVKIARHVAKARHEYTTSHGGKDNKRGNQDDVFTAVEGFAAEMAFCKMMNVYPDFNTEHFDSQIDCVTEKYGTVDVKATKYQNGKLLAVTNKKYKGNLPDTYVLMVGTCPEYRFAGWLPAEELFNRTNLGDLGHGQTYMVDQKNLRKK